MSFDLNIHFELNPEISKIKGVSERFWDQIVIDGLIGNNDRNNGNWGILANGDKRELAPVFDNGACFYPKKSTLAIQQLLQLPEADQARNNSNIQEPFTLDGEHHLNYKTMLELDETKIPGVHVKLLKDAVEKNIALVDKNLNTIVDFIKSIPNECKGYEIITEPRREYYLKSFMTRFEDVLRRK